VVDFYWGYTQLQGEHRASSGSAILRDVLDLLVDLKQTPAGLVIHDQITRLLIDCETEQHQTEQDYLELVTVLLEAYSRNPSSQNVMRVTARLIQLRSVKHLNRATIDALRDELLPGEAPQPAQEKDERELDEVMQGLNRWAAADKQRRPAAPAAPATVAGEAGPPQMAPTQTTHNEVAAAAEYAARTRAGEKKMQQMLVDEEAGNAPPAERRVDTAYRLHLDRKRDEIDMLQETLVNKMADAIDQNKEFGMLLEIERGAMQQAENLQEIESLRQILLGCVDELLQGQRALGNKLRGSKDYLQLVKSDSERLHDELNKVRLLSLTDEFTGLPNRRAFMRRLDDEIGRSQRYATPLALVMIDLDGFKMVNDTRGHAAGDEVLRCYANDVLSVFRHHDMVARYGGEEFSVLLPNTASEDALSAMRKVQGRVASILCEYEGRKLTLPTFSAGLTLYVPGESPAALIERADRALYSAKRRGRNRVEVDFVVPEKTVAPNGAGDD
jgi:diguanylate cyclase (GGDEF)-like protein